MQLLVLIASKLPACVAFLLSICEKGFTNRFKERKKLTTSPDNCSNLRIILTNSAPIAVACLPLDVTNRLLRSWFVPSWKKQSQLQLLVSALDLL